MFEGKSILVTGGTGSFGKEFVKTALAKYKLRKIIIYSRDELKQSEMQSLAEFKDPAVRFFLGDVRDRDRLELAMRGVDYVVHAAALKQVPSCEFYPIEAVKTNIFGTLNVVEASVKNSIDK